MTAPAEGALRILKLEPVDFCCGEVLAESQMWVLAEDRTGKRLSRRFLPPVGSAHLNQNMPPVLRHRRHGLYTSFSK